MTTVPEQLAIAGGVLCILALAFAVVLIYFFDAVLKDRRETTEQAFKQLRRALDCALILRGLNPNVVDPETYAPEGMPRRDAPLLPENPLVKKKVLDAEAALDAEEEALREAERDYFKRVAEAKAMTRA